MASFVVFEGGDACGKSTQAARVATRLDAVLTREPGGTAIGIRVRELLLSTDTVALSPRAEALLMAADRAQHVDELIRPSLAAGRHVVSDRFYGSSLAYQGSGRELGNEPVWSLSKFAIDGVEPDLVVVLDVPVGVARARRTGPVDRLEGEDEAFHERVRHGFLALVAKDPERWVALDGTAPIDDVSAAVDQVLRERLDL